jgi:hypothetical protein
MVYRLVRGYSAALGFEIGAHALRATAATNALDHQADMLNPTWTVGRDFAIENGRNAGG